MAGMFLAISRCRYLRHALSAAGFRHHQGARFGALIGVFLWSFVVHNYFNLNIGLKLTLEQAVAYFIEWTVTGIVIGLIYRPAVPH